MRTNVIWIFGDQHRAQALSCAGDPNVSTPNIDRMAGEGLNFASAVAGFPLCCPFRGSLLTSRYPHHCVPGHEYQLPPDQPTIAHVFREAGYHTAYFGKWHVDGFKERNGRAAMHIVPPERRGGFDTWIGYENNNSQWDSWVHGGEGDNAFHYRLPGYETDCLTDLLIDYVRERGERGPGASGKTGTGASSAPVPAFPAPSSLKQAPSTLGDNSAQTRYIPQHAGGLPAPEAPFFAVLSVQPPHNPYVAPAEFMARHNPQRLTLRPNVPCVPRIEQQARRDLAGAYAQIENLDWNIGRVLEAVREAGLWENTQIVFFSDHGDLHGSHGQFRKTAPWQEAIAIPMIVSGGDPYRFGSGERPHPVNHVDIAPTTLGLCGIDVPAWMEGTDYSPCRTLAGPIRNEPDSAFLQQVIPTGHGHSIDRPWRGVITTDGWKYVALEHQPWLMFNLNDDPYEQANLAHNSGHGRQRTQLHDRLRQWIADTGDEFAMPTL